MLAVTWGPMSEWFAGGATLAAVVSALFFSVRGDRRSEEARLRAVYAWCESHVHPHEGPRWLILVNNQTQFPVSEWSVELSWTTPLGKAPMIETLDQTAAGVVPPGRQVFPWSPESAPLSDSDVAVTFSFTDGSGRRVTRGTTISRTRTWRRLLFHARRRCHRRANVATPSDG